MIAPTEKPLVQPEQNVLRPDIPQRLGASACAGCPFVQLGCPGKAEVAAECPPQAKVIQQHEVLGALFDDNVASISVTSGGELYTTIRQPVITFPPQSQPVKKLAQPQRALSPEMQPPRKLSKKQVQTSIGQAVADMLAFVLPFTPADNKKRSIL